MSEQPLSVQNAPLFTDEPPFEGGPIDVAFAEQKIEEQQQIDREAPAKSSETVSRNASAAGVFLEHVRKQFTLAA